MKALSWQYNKQGKLPGGVSLKKFSATGAVNNHGSIYFPHILIRIISKGNPVRDLWKTAGILKCQ